MNLAMKSPWLSTPVPTVKRFPLWILGAGWLLVVFNITGGLDYSATIPGLDDTGPTGDQAALMLLARQFGQAFILALGLLQKRVRTLQALWLMVIIREAIDFAARLNRGEGLNSAAFIATLAIEAAAFIYLGMIAAGRIAEYDEPAPI